MFSNVRCNTGSNYNDPALPDNGKNRDRVKSRSILKRLLLVLARWNNNSICERLFIKLRYYDGRRKNTYVPMCMLFIDGEGKNNIFVARDP